MHCSLKLSDIIIKIVGVKIFEYTENKLKNEFKRKFSNLKNRENQSNLLINNWYSNCCIQFITNVNQNPVLFRIRFKIYKYGIFKFL